jgi:two-component sensor histidine kinase
MSSVPFEMSREELQALHEKYREIKHDINNTLAVIMALSELAQRNPAHYEKLAKAVLTRGPDVVQKLQDFQTALGAKLKEGGAPPTSSAPTSGVF